MHIKYLSNNHNAKKMHMRYKFIFSFILLISTNRLFAEQHVYKRILITKNKTTHIVLPCAIDYYDIGNLDMIEPKQDEKKQPNMLKIKVLNNYTIKNDETNVTIRTTDDTYYTLMCKYVDKPDTLLYFIKKPTLAIASPTMKLPIDSTIDKVTEHVGATSVLINPYKIVCERIFFKGYSTCLKGSIVEKIKFLLNNLYIHDDKIYFYVTIRNNSKIPFTIADLTVSIENKVKASRVGTQSYPLPIIYALKDIKTIQPNTQIDQIIVVDKFTIPENKILLLELVENNGERLLDIEIDGQEILKTITIE